MAVIVPPIKCQGIKTKLVNEILSTAQPAVEGRWIEPFCGSCVVALNVKPKQALLADTNVHIIGLYKAIQNRSVTPGIVKQFLEEQGELLRKGGADYYYQVRERFNSNPGSLDFLFLNRSCFNGVMRFNRHGKFNVPFGHKPNRFAQAYVTKITNQVRKFSEILANKDWIFEVSDFKDTLEKAKPDDLVYVDPPYAGRHVDYFNSWSDIDEAALTKKLKMLPCRFILSTWHSNSYRENTAVQQHWHDNRYHIQKAEHFYHVGATEALRNAMTEALITNYEVFKRPALKQEVDYQPVLF